MNRLFILTLSVFLFLTLSTRANETLSSDMPVFQGAFELVNSGRSLSYAFAAGDKVFVKIGTPKKRELRSVRLTTLTGEVVWSRDNTASFEIEIPIQQAGVYTFNFEKRGLFKFKANVDISRKAGSVAQHNTAFRKHNIYTPELVKFKVDSAIGYQSAAYNMQEFKVFNKYYFQNVSLFSHKSQVKGNLALDGNHVKGYPLAIKPELVPADAKLKSYTYSLNSVLGGQQHWRIAELTAQIGGTAASIFLTPAAGFAVHGTMALIGPSPSNAPVLYYMSNRHSDIKTVGEIKSNYTKAATVSNTAVNIVSAGLGFFSDKAAKKVDKLKVDTKDEGDLDFTQKGNVTNLFVSSAIPPTEQYFIMTNSYVAQAKNISLNGTALYYFPTYFTVRAQEEDYKLKTTQIQKEETKINKRTNFVSIND